MQEKLAKSNTQLVPYTGPGRAVKKTITKKSFGADVVSYGSDFAGLGTSGIALQKLLKKTPEVNLKGRHVFACDQLSASKRFIMHSDPAERWDPDILTRGSMDELPVGKLAMYFFTSPCQGLSSAGLQQGAQDPRTQLFFSSVAVVEKYQPKCFLCENVNTLATWSKYKPFLEKIVEALESAGYTVEYRILNSDVYVPHHRPRFYMMGIRNDQVRTQTKGVPKWPEFDFKPPTLQSIIQPLPTKLWKLHPPKKEAKGLHYNNVLSAYRAAQVNPYIHPLIIDMKASERFSTWRDSESPCLTRSRCSNFGHWCSTKGGVLSVEEYARLQGFKPVDIPWKEAGLKEGQVAGMLGNGQTLPLVMNLLPNLMFHASLINFAQYQALKKVRLL